MRPFKDNDLVILLGAGASADAGIFMSQRMVTEVEKLVEENDEWKTFQKFYYYIKSSIYYSDGIRGKFNTRVIYNIERFFDTIEEIKKKQEHILFPFIASWNQTLIEVAGSSFERADDFSKKIVREMKRWIALKKKSDALYYKKIENLHDEYNFPLRIFSLNYDLCVEKECSSEILERGFNERNIWDWRQFDESIQENKFIYLYKLHGSLDWVYDEKNNELTFSDEPQSIDKPEIIFGTSYKYQYKDPFLFLAYEFRKRTLESQIILAIGYGFGDEHINQIIQQALIQRNNRVLVCVVGELPSDKNKDQKIEDIRIALGMKESNQIKVVDSKAKNFMENNMNLAFLSQFLPETEDDIFS
jgi:hypothetical protein